MLAGIGSMIGFGFFTEAIIVSVVTLLILLIVGFIEDKFPRLHGGLYSRNNGSNDKVKKEL